MLKSFFYLSLLLCIMSCDEESTPTCESKPKIDCDCITLFDPVCSCNNKIYGNSCAAECDGVTVLYTGNCGVHKILGQWQMMGYIKKDKVDVNNVSRKIPYDNVTVVFNNKEEDKKLQFSGRSSVNFIGGIYETSNLNTSDDKLKITNTIRTKIAGTIEALQFEDEYVDNLNNAASYNIKGTILTIKVIKAGQNIDEMVFIKM
jgi:heat shock protein HslJ